MLVGKVEHLKTNFFKDFFEITKGRLSISVVFSSITGYLLATEVIDTLHILYLFLGGFCMVGASNTLNQVIERDYDAVMKRTQNRPIPKGRMSITSALIISILMIIVGFFLLNKLNFKTAFFSFFSVLIYVSIYTPLKTITPLSVFVGAIPGAIPFMLGWVAATNQFGIEPGTLFMIQFFWQFPHFWSLGWMLDDDYKKAGFIMLPTGNRDKKTALQIILYTLWLIVISVFPATGLTGLLMISLESAIIILVLGLIMLFMGINLYNGMNIASAKRLFMYTIFYLTSVQLIYIIDKFI